MTTDQIVERIMKAADEADAAGVRSALAMLQRQLADTGAVLSDGSARRLVEAMTMMPLQTPGRDPQALAETVINITKAKPLDKAALTASWSKFYDIMRDPAAPISTDLLRDTMGALRAKRMFDMLGKTADRALLRQFGSGETDPHFRRLYAQSLIDSGHIVAGIEVLENTLKSGVLPLAELRQVRGLLGRAHKQIYVNHVGGHGASRQSVKQYAKAIEQSAKYYAADYDPQRAAETSWHGSNLVAILKRAEADGLAVDVGFKADDVARTLITSLSPKIDAGAADPWDMAVVAECHYALGEYEQARLRFGQYAERADAFALAGTTRQLHEVWRTQDSANPQAIECLQVLNGALTQLDRATILISHQEAVQLQKAMASPEGQRILESRVKGGDFVKIRQLQDLMRSAAAVASVRAKNAIADYAAGDRIGTAFLFRGRDLSAKLDDGLYLMTNAHVIADADYPRHSHDWPLLPDNAEIIFEQTILGTNVKAQFVPEIVHCFPSHDHDCTILKVTTAPESVAPVRLEMERKPVVRTKSNPGTNVCVIGHPEGQELQISFKDSFLKGDNGQVVDLGPRQRGSDGAIYVHYDTPTEGGNSGSPVFDRDTWTVIGLHHAGVGYERLNGAGGRQDANEGIYIKSIAEAVRKAKGTKGRNEARGRGWLRRRSI
jgi:tetratricopeptide (TPR) repeat protein